LRSERLVWRRLQQTQCVGSGLRILALAKRLAWKQQFAPHGLHRSNAKLSMLRGVNHEVGQVLATVSTKGIFKWAAKSGLSGARAETRTTVSTMQLRHIVITEPPDGVRGNVAPKYTQNMVRTLTK
jgi:hypothetical protein